MSTSDARNRFGTELKTIQKQTRMGLRELARLSGISANTISNLKRGADPRTGKTPMPRPDTIRRLAEGLATDPLEDRVNQTRADAFYRRLMSAAGYFK